MNTSEQNLDWAVMSIRDITSCTRDQAEQVVHAIAAYITRGMAEELAARNRVGLGI